MVLPLALQQCLAPSKTDRIFLSFPKQGKVIMKVNTHNSCRYRGTPEDIQTHILHGNQCLNSLDFPGSSLCTIILDTLRQYP